MRNNQLFDIVCLNNNIVPLHDTLNKNVNNALSCLDSIEAHAMKRKFRKLWRKAADKFHPMGKEHRSFSSKGQNPNKWQRKNRKLIVLRLFRDVVKENFNQSYWSVEHQRL